ncbi:DUF6415 family natural product biosynthesis protein [Streptomyces virginiae]|uniref:DUF6415 family natural product biosynthesis protein n=1 Tax=Streptomyces virginiae TaxID=1961 RepID=UPI0035DC473B
MQPSQDEITEVTKLVRRALGSYNLKPDATELSSLTDDLLNYGERYTARARHLVDAPAVRRCLQDWSHLRSRGPEDEPLGNWSYARSLARVVRTLHNALSEEGGCGHATGRAACPQVADGGP